MKVIYSQIKKILPGLKKSPRQIANDFTMIGHFCSGLEKIGPNTVITLEVRHNRGDCFGYFGLAKELSVLYTLPICLPQISQNASLLPLPPVQINSQSGVKRLMAATLTGLKNKTSPAWLTGFLKLHDINSLNLLVDLTNYVMIYWGLPCHAFDLKKLDSDLTWQDSTQNKDFTTFDQTKIEIEKGTLEIVSRDQAVSLTFIGGLNSGISLNTTETLVEMAVYDPMRVRKDSQNYKIDTEASIRLEKFLDPELIPLAFNHLLDLIQKYCQGKLNSQLFDYYPQKEKLPQISLDPQDPSRYAGMKIPSSFTLETLKNLDCSVEKKSNHLLVDVPSLRKDIQIKEDLIEEVIRFWGYQKIPQNQPLPFKKRPDITPPVLYLIEHLQQMLTVLGYDETRSWPLLNKKQINLQDPHLIYTQNNINSHFPALRTSLVPSLKIQKEQYEKYKVSPIQIFEIGKIYLKKAKKYEEHYTLALYHPQKDQLNHDFLFLLRNLGLAVKDLKFVKLGPDYYYEIRLNTILRSVEPRFLQPLSKKTNPKTSAYELKKQIITLDANLNLGKKVDFDKLIRQYSQKIGDKYLWKLEITDFYQDPKNKKYRYTLRSSYYNLDSKKAKALHLKTFGLK
jgi:phenylalanyl-tRNA synthetase beta chain